MPNWEEGKRPKTRKDKAERKIARRQKKVHPVMEEHPGDRVPDPVTGEKPKPVRKPRAKKPKPTPETPASTGSSPEPSADTTEAPGSGDAE